MFKFMKKKATRCETCVYYEYDEDYGYYICNVNLDEDEMLRFIEQTYSNCPYYNDGDEYKIVRKQN